MTFVAFRLRVPIAERHFVKLAHWMIWSLLSFVAIHAMNSFVSNVVTRNVRSRAIDVLIGNAMCVVETFPWVAVKQFGAWRVWMKCIAMNVMYNYAIVRKLRNVMNVKPSIARIVVTKRWWNVVVVLDVLDVDVA